MTVAVESSAAMFGCLTILSIQQMQWQEQDRKRPGDCTKEGPDDKDAEKDSANSGDGQGRAFEAAAVW